MNTTIWPTNHVMRVVMILIACHLLPVSVTAQTFTQQVQSQQAGQGKVTIYQDAAIDQLVNGAQVYQQPVENRQQRQDQPQANGRQNPGQTGSQNHGGQTHEQGGTQTQAQTDSSQQDEQQTGQRHRVVGYRVQAYSGGNTRQDRMKAEQAGNAISQQFPGIYVEVHFYSPSWKCRVGNYRNYEDAKEMRDEIRRMGYPSATIVKGKITVTD